MSFCTKCGNKLSTNARFCTNCGSPSALQIEMESTGPTMKSSARNVSRNIATDKAKSGKVKHYLMAAGTFILLISNPSAIDFEIYLSSQLNQRFPQQQEGGDFFANLIQGAVKNIATDYLKQSTERNNYFLFSTYTVNLSGIQSFVGSLPPSAKFLGVLGNFIPLSDMPSN